MKQCLRCGEHRELSDIGAVLVNFVCDGCRKDSSGWEFNGVRLQDMEYQSVEHDALKESNEAKYEIQKYN